MFYFSSLRNAEKSANGDPASANRFRIALYESIIDQPVPQG